MGSEAVVPAVGEVRAVAELLGHSPTELTAIKLPGPGRIAESVLTVRGPLPRLEGFGLAEHVDVEWGGESKHFAARYDSQARSLVVVSHETGPEIFVLLPAVAAATTVIRGAYDFIRWVRQQRPDRLGVNVDDTPIQFWFVEDGHIQRREVVRLEPTE